MKEMRGKGLILFFSIVLILVSIYQLSFTLVVSRVEKRIKEQAWKPYEPLLQEEYLQKQFGHNWAARLAFVDSITELARDYEARLIDSIANQPVYNLLFTSFTYMECKERELNVGLDLRGGMSVVLEVDLVDLVSQLAGERMDATLRHALQNARRRLLAGGGDFFALLQEEFERLAPADRLARYFLSQETSERLSLTSSNSETIEYLREEAREALRRTYRIIQSRIDRFGVAQPSLLLDPASQRIIVELPGVDNPHRVRRILHSTAKLEFWETYTSQEIFPYLQRANERLRTLLLETHRDTLTSEPLPPPSATETELPSLLKQSPTPTDTLSQQPDTTPSLLSITTTPQDTSALPPEETGPGPLFEMLIPPMTAEGTLSESPVAGYARGEDTAKINRYLSMAEVRALLPRNALPAWGAKPEDNGMFALYILKSRAPRPIPALTGEVVVDARVEFDPMGRPAVGLTMNAEGARRWRRLTAENVGKFIAIVLDGRVYSAPRVEEEIPTGRSQITGAFTLEEATDLATILETGKLPTRLEIVEESVVGPSLGKEAVRAGVRALVIGFVGVVLFMVLNYMGAGLISVGALLLNLFYIIGVLSAFGAVLTLPGIAGLVLTIGMAVDANIIVYERIREELRKEGKSLRMAIMDGFKSSRFAVIDANITTLLAGIILLWVGLGPLRGFATVLVIGILSTLLTAFLLTRIAFEELLSRGIKVNFGATRLSERIEAIKIDWLKWRKFSYLLSAILVTVSVVSMVVRGFQFGVDFLGGRDYVVRFPEPVNVEQVRDSLKKALEGASVIVKSYGSTNQIRITTTYLIESDDPKADSAATARLFEALKPWSGAGTLDAFLRHNLVMSQKISSTIADDLRRSGIWATIVGLLAMFVYIALRFRSWQFGVGAVVALLHDALIVLGAFSLLHGVVGFSLEVDQAFVGALLTIIGYSINDTVVIFDRIREILSMRGKLHFAEAINTAINLSKTRTLYTSLTTLIVTVVLLVLGGESLKGFAFALTLGVIVGTYSSDFLAAPIMYDLSRRRKHAS